MPLFEYRCRDCARQFTFLAGVVADNSAAACPRCGSSHLSKLISRFSSGRSDDARLEGMADRLDGQDLDDPRAIRRFAREMGREMGAESGEDLSEEMEQLIQEEASPGSTGGLAGGDDGSIY